MGTSDLPHTHDKAPRKDGRSKKVQDKLDDALADSFPASDPVSIVTSHAEDDWMTREEGGGADADEATSESGGKRPGDEASRQPPAGNLPAGGH